MSSSSSEQVALSVRAADRLTEVFLADSRFELLASGIGALEAKVPPGLYKARFRVGQVQSDSLIEVAAGTPSKIFDGPPVQFASSAPLAQTLTYQQKQAEAAQELSRTVHFQLGSGSQLFLFLRGLSEEAARPWLGVSLHDISGKLLAEAAQGVCDAESRFGALHIELNPGLYRLRVEEEPGEVYEMFVLTLAGWQTQVFAIAEKSWLPGVDAVRAALPDAAVLMTELGKGFAPASPAARQTELLRLGLLHGRKILNEPGWKSLLAAQPLNPMNLLFAVHILLRQEDTASAAELAGQAESALAALPDVQAALLGSGRAAEPPVFDRPPLFNRSWQLILDAVSKEKAGFAPGSLCGQLHNGTLHSTLWLLRQLR
ncbi:hypothetical protein [Candidatus Electronema sp. TJ]|uniref:hypothetical protein n=1 Tax=Candidatus Electronema sp. TJ TaxID=3401573 RepID=UPI003AA93074